MEEDKDVEIIAKRLENTDKRMPKWVKIILILLIVVIIVTGVFLLIYIPLAIICAFLSIVYQLDRFKRIDKLTLLKHTAFGPFYMIYALFKFIINLFKKGINSIIEKRREKKAESDELMAGEGTIDF